MDGKAGMDFEKEENEDLFQQQGSSKEYQKRDLCCCVCLPKRYLVAILSFFGFVNVYALRVNLSVGLVAMVSNSTKKYPNGTEYVVSPPEFNWDSRVQGLLLSSFFYGYIFTQIPGGWLATKYGGKNLFGGGILATALFTLITPPAARISPYLLASVRILEGLCEGVTFPCIHAIWSKWAPPLERSKLATISFSGACNLTEERQSYECVLENFVKFVRIVFMGPFAGTVIAMPLSGLIAEAYGWPWVFYFFGLCAVVWSFFWFWLVTNSPKDQPKITEEELEYIESSLQSDKPDKKIGKTPWLAFVKSPAVWAIIVAHTTENWGWYTLLTQLPTYLKKILHFTLEEAGFVSALPYLAMVLVVQIGGRLADFIRASGLLSTTAVRKLFNSVGFLSQAAFLVVVGYTTNKQLAIIGLTLAVGFGGFTWSGFPVNHLDIAPRYASILFGISNCVATLPGIFSPIMVGFITEKGTQEEWRNVFFIAAAIYLFGLIFFLLFASGEKQSWADETYTRDGLINDNELEKLLDEKQVPPPQME